MANFQTVQVQNQELYYQPKVMLNPPRGGQGQAHWLHATFTVPTTTVSAADTIELIRVPSSARVLMALVRNESLGSVFTGNLGLAVITKTGGGTEVLSVGGASVFHNALALAGANSVWTNIGASASSQWTPANVGKACWELTNTITYTQDPYLEFSIYFTCSTITTQTNGAVAAFQFLVA
jgi:hypothetical protein